MSQSICRCLSIITSKDLNTGVLNFILLPIQCLHTIIKLRTPTDTVETRCLFMLGSKAEFAVPRLCGCSSVRRRLANEIKPILLLSNMVQIITQVHYKVFQCMTLGLTNTSCGNNVLTFVQTKVYRYKSMVMYSTIS